MISRSIDQLTCQCRPFRCCQAYPGDQGHHDKPSHPAARHDCLDGDTTRDLRIACADRSTCRRASQGRGPPGRQEGSTEGRSAGCRTEGAGTSATAGCGTSASGTAAATAARCGSATTSSAAAATAGCRASSASDAASAASRGCASAADTTRASTAATGCCAEGPGTTSAASGGCTFAPHTHRRLLRRQPHLWHRSSRPHRHPAATSSGPPRRPPRWREAAAGTCHHAGPDSAAGRCAASTRRKHDGATAASRRTGNASECGRPDNCTDHAARATRRAAACRAERWRRPRRSRRNATGGARSHGTDRRAGRAELRATARPGAKRPADGRTGFPACTASHRTAASGTAAGRRRDQSRLPAGAPPAGPQRLDDFRGQRRESQQGGRTVITEPGRIIIRDPGGQSYVRHSEVDRFRYGARDIRPRPSAARPAPS